jgi:hypothetical protein
MHKPSSTKTIRSCALMIAVLAVTSGCETTSTWFKGFTTRQEEPIILGAPGAGSYLSDMYKLAGGDPATQAEIFAGAEAAARLTPGTMTNLRFALVLATPGHRETNAVAAQSMLRELLSQPELMTPGEMALATIHLREVEERLVLDAETRRLRSENTRTATTEEAAMEAAVARRIANVEAENRRLRRSLDDAESKLDALSAIERSLREQSSSGEPPQ